VGETSSPFTTTSVTTETFCPEPSNSAALGALGRRNTLGASSLGRYDRPSIREGDRDRPVLVRPPDLGADTIQLRERVGVGVSVGVGLAESGVLPPLPQTSGPFTTTSVTHVSLHLTTIGMFRQRRSDRTTTNPTRREPRP
jgi:hypothetical protein